MQAHTRVQSDLIQVSTMTSASCVTLDALRQLSSIG